MATRTARCRVSVPGGTAWSARHFAAAAGITRILPSKSPAASGCVVAAAVVPPAFWLGGRRQYIPSPARPDIFVVGTR